MKGIFFILFATSFFLGDAQMIKCHKKDICSCETDTNPKYGISLWHIKPDFEIRQPTGIWLYAVDLCHGVKITVMTNGTELGCNNSTVCRYDHTKPTKAYNLGQYGSAQFGDYDNLTKSIKIHYSGRSQNNVTRNITISLKCKNSTKDEYRGFKPKGIFDTNNFIGSITSKAGCLVRQSEPEPVPVNPLKKTSKGLGTIYIVLISLGSAIVFVIVCGLVVFSVVKKRTRRSLLDDEMQQDYGTTDNHETPAVQIQNAFPSERSKPL